MRMFRLFLALAVMMSATAIAGSRAGSAGDADQLVTAFVEGFNTSFAKQTDSWVRLCADDVDWSLPTPPNGNVPQESGKRTLFIWTKSAVGSEWYGRTLVEKRRIVQGNVAAWEGTWEPKADRPGEKLPIAMIIEFNGEQKVQSLHAYAADTAQAR